MSIDKKSSILILLLFLANIASFGQDITAIPEDRDSLEAFIQFRKKSGKKDWNYFLAIKEMSKKVMFEDRRKTVEYLEEADRLAKAYKDTVEMGTISHLLGMTYRHYGYIYMAAEYFQQSYLLTEGIGKRDYAGWDLLSIGNLYFDLKKWDEATIYYTTAYKGFLKIGETSGVAVAYNNLGLVYQEKKLYDSAHQYFTKALEIRRATKDSILIAHSMSYLAFLFLETGDYNKALNSANQALYRFNNPEFYSAPHYDLAHLPLALNYHIGLIYQKMSKPDSAMHYFEKAIEMGRKDPKLTEYFLSSFRASAMIKIKEGKRGEAIDLLEDALSYTPGLHFTDEQEAILLLISDLLEVEGNYSKAAFYLREYQEILKNKALGASNQMLNFHALYQTYEQKSALQEQNLLLEKERLERKQQRQFNQLIAIALIIALVGLIFVFMLYRRIQKINVTLGIRNKAIEEQKNIIESNAKELEQLNEAKDLLFSIIAHDLRSPFNTLTNFSKLMQSYISNNQWQELKRSFKILDESAQKAYTTFENLLGWVQSQTGKLRANVEVVDIPMLLEETLGLLRSMTTLKNIQIEYSIAHPFVLGDTHMFETVLRNILTNALKYTNEGGKITIETKKEADNITIIIADDGEGISENALKDIFDASKLKATSQSVSGLGLLICKNFMDSMGGEIYVESEKGQGTKFYLELPECKDSLLLEKQVKNNGIIKHNQEHSAIKAEDLKAEKSEQVLKNILLPYAASFQEVSVYEASEVKLIIQKIRETKPLEKEVEDWLSSLNDALYLGDAELFDKLICAIND